MRNKHYQILANFAALLSRVSTPRLCMHSAMFTNSVCAPPQLQNSKGNPLSGALNTSGGKILQISPFTSKTERDGAIYLIWNTNKKS